MDPVSAAISIAGAAATTCSVVWKVCEQWRDAPAEIHHLKDTVLQADEFFQRIQYSMKDDSSGRMLASNPNELSKLLHNGETVLHSIRSLLSSLCSNGSDVSGCQEFSRRRRLKWLKNLHETKKLRRRLREIMAQTCALLLSQNL